MSPLLVDVVSRYNIFPEPQTVLISLFICYAVYKIVNFYILVFSLPPGPIPLPILGNILMFRKSVYCDQVFRECGQKYGPVFTVWLANKPAVVITDVDLLREAFRHKNLMGRPQTYLGSYVSNEKFQNILLTDYSKSWDALWHVLRAAVQKYSTNVKLERLVSESVDNTIDLIMEREGIDKEFSIQEYIEMIILNIMARMAFNINYSLEDEDFTVIRDVIRVGGSGRMVLWEFSPLIRLIDWSRVKKFIHTIKAMITIVSKHFARHKSVYDESIERDICDALICAKNTALRYGKEWAPYLTDNNLAIMLMDVIAGGSDSSGALCQWMVLLMTYYPQTQQKLRQEIETQIGNRIATHEDRNQCHYVMAFMAESLRFRNPTPIASPHKTLDNFTVGDYTIPPGTTVLGTLGLIMMDEKYWPKAQEFTPERFLKNGKYVKSRSKAYMPFGVGRRACLGERLAIADLFLVFVRFIQKTADYDIVLGTNRGIEPSSRQAVFCFPQNYKILFKPRSNKFFN